MLKRDKIRKEIMRCLSFATTHHIAKRCECTPSYVRKVGMDLFNQGKVAYRRVPHQGNSGFAYVFVGVWYAVAYNQAPETRRCDRYVLPEIIQQETAI